MLGSLPQRASCSAVLHGRRLPSYPRPLCLRLAGRGASSMAEEGREDLEHLTVEALKQRCREQGLKVGECRRGRGLCVVDERAGGRKADLIERLQGRSVIMEERREERREEREEEEEEKDEVRTSAISPTHGELRLEIIACKS
eukprot:768819-Hanusia_phi.AAC.2